MPDLEQRMRGIDHLPAPDLLDRARVEARTVDIEPSPPMGRRVVIIAAALVLSAAALGWLWMAFHAHREPQPVTPPVSTRNGDIWVNVYRVADTDPYTTEKALYRVDPEHPRSHPVWTDSPKVFTKAQNAPQLVSRDYAFSPGGRRVAFSALIGGWRGPRELFVMNADGTGLRQLTHDRKYSSSPAWSPDGTTIAYARSAVMLNPTHVYLIGANGGASTRIVGEPGMSEWDPSWSPDGTRIAFAETDPDGLDSIVSVRTDGTDRIGVASGRVSSPAWAPDGRSIAFLRKLDGSTRIWIVSPDGSGERELVDTESHQHVTRPIWSPDGSLIVLALPSGRASTALWLFDPAGNTPPERVVGWRGFYGVPVAWQPAPNRGAV
jgi:TolB protein